MIKNLLLLSSFFLINYSLKAQEHFISYHNDAEKTLMANAKLPDDYIKLALTAKMSEADANSTIAQLNDHIKQLDWESTANQKPERRLKQLFQMVHATFLKRYEEKASFDQLFTTGEYQCAGASILYAYILDKFQVPYEIKELPTHVYVVAYPGSYNILLETTDPEKGYFVPDAKSKENYINALIKTKYLDPDYVKKVGTDKAFDEFFYSKTNISLKEAVGVLYYNDAIEEMDDTKYSDAYSNIAKAQVLYPAKKNEFLQNAIMEELVKNFKFEDIKDWEGLVYSVNSSNSDEDKKKYVEFQFDNLIQKKLWKAGQKNKVDEVHNYLEKNLKDSTLKNDIEDEYLIENARYAYTSNNYTDAQTYLEKAIARNPTDPQPKSLLTDMIGPKFAGQPSSETVKSLDQYIARFPFLGNDPRIRSICLYSYSYLTYYYFSINDGQQGDKYLKTMCNELDTHSNYQNKNEEQIALAFGRASEFYYRKYGKSKSIEILNTGLKYAPANELLLRKIKVLKESKY
ncbi:MAG TPA: hypothetical protein VIM89_06970 [Mucilaginibacter sp.]